MSGKSIVVIFATVAVVFLFLIIGVAGCEVVDDSEIVVYQSYSGEREVWTTPGYKITIFGKTTSYNKADEFYFAAKQKETENQGAKKKTNEYDDLDTTDCLRTRFNDQGAAHICGQVTFRLPLDEKQMLKIHSEYRGMDGVRERLIKPNLTTSVYFSGPLMSSRESAGQNRPLLSEYINEQAKFGVYQTKQTKAEVEDLTSPPLKTIEIVKVPVKDDDGKVKLGEDGKPILEEKAQEILQPRKKTVEVLEPQVGKNGENLFQRKSLAASFGISLGDITVEHIVYEPKAKEQIDRQRDLEMQVQTQIAEAEKAKQEAITAEQTGRAQAAKAKWDQEVKKATAVTAAQQKREVAQEDLLAAELERKAMVERAKGEAEAKKLVMDADGALDKKLAAWKEVQKAYAAEMGKQRWVPDVVMGGSNNHNAAMDLMQLWQVKAARDLGLDLGVKR